MMHRAQRWGTGCHQTDRGGGHSYNIVVAHYCNVLLEWKWFRRLFFYFSVGCVAKTIILDLEFSKRQAKMGKTTT